MSYYYFHDASGNVMGIYKYENDSLYLEEQMMYGSSRIGSLQLHELLPDTTVTDSNLCVQKRGQKRYELTNHLGNVLTTITDRRTFDCDKEFYAADLVSVSDYSAFGAPLAGRTWNTGDSYRFGFNGQEKLNELNGEGNAYGFEYRANDSRTGRFLSIDPLSKKYPWNSPYAFAENKPIQFIELEGLETSPAFGTDPMATAMYHFGTYLTAASKMIPNPVVTVKPYIATTLATVSNAAVALTGLPIPQSNSAKVEQNIEVSTTVEFKFDLYEFMKSEGKISGFTLDLKPFIGLVSNMEYSVYQEGMPVPVYVKIETRVNMLNGDVQRTAEIGLGTEKVNVNVTVDQSTTDNGSSTKTTTTTTISTGAKVNPELDGKDVKVGVEFEFKLEKDIYTDEYEK